jgi:hypothetical protein
MAALVALLIIVPATADPGRVEFSDVNESTIAKVVDPTGNDFALTVGTGLMTSIPSTGDLTSEGDGDTVSAQTKLEEGDIYVSNDSSAYNLVIFSVTPIPAEETAGDRINERLVSVRPSSGSTKQVEVDSSGVGYFRVLAQETTTSNVKDEYEGVYNLAFEAADAEDAAVITAANDATTPVGTRENDGDVIETRKGQEVFEAYLEGGTVTLTDGNDQEYPGLLPAINAREIEAVHGDTITIDGDVEIVVDARAPAFEDVSPGNKHLQDDDNVDFAFTLTDNNSGLRSDREADNLDRDSVGREPLAQAFGYGEDIGVFLTVSNPGFGDAPPGLGTEIDANTTRVDNRGNDDWDEEARDHSYSVDFRTATLDEGTHEWFILARDRVGNEARYPSKAGTYYTVTVDETGPEVLENDVYAGIGFDDGEEVYDSSSILVIFHNEGEHGLDPDTIETGAFRVVGNDVVDVIYPGNALSLDDDDEECESDTGLVNPGTDDCINTLNRMYLVLGSPLDDDETPEVQISSSQFTDRADNGNESVEEEAADWILPTLTITVTGDANADGRPLAQEEITVRVESGELLLRRPSIWLVTVDAEGNINDAGLSRTLGTITGESMAWESDFEADQFAGLSGDSGFGAIIIQAEDRSPQRNEVSSAGWKGKGTIPNDEDELVLAKMDAAGLLVEFDADVPVAEVEVTPNRGDDRETESGNPFIKLTFGEGTEYTSETIPEVDAVEDDDSTQADESKDAIPAIPGDKSVTQGDDKTTIDSYDEVTITSITLNGDDVSNGLARIDDAEFNLSLRGLDVGDYTIEYTASDTAGNEITEEEEFAVLDRSDYEIELRPGWNLVSLPASPGDPAVGSVLGADHGASTVLSYQSGEWVSATRDAETGGWVGTLTDMVAGYGYFVQTDSFDPLATLIPEADPTTALPTVPVSSGWNLLGVVDVGQRDAGATIDADLYFASIEWSVAYGFDTTTNRWEKLTEDASDNPDTADEDENAYVENGAGYWVWATKAGTLVP